VGHYMFLAWIMLRPQGEEGHGDLAMSQYCWERGWVGETT
jgi:hypothetical protein